MDLLLHHAEFFLHPTAVCPCVASPHVPYGRAEGSVDAVSPSHRGSQSHFARLNDNVFRGADSFAEEPGVAFGAVLFGPAPKTRDGDLFPDMAGHLQHC